MLSWPKIAGSLKRLLIWVLLLTTWEAAYRTIQWRSYIFPAPSQIADSLFDMLGFSTGFGEPLHPGWPKASEAPANPPPAISRLIHSPLLGSNLISAARLVVGFSISVIGGALLGSVMWRLKSVDEFLGPVFLGLQTLPSVCWVPLAVLLFGLNEFGILFVLVMGSMFGISISMRDGLRAIPPAYRTAGLMLGARKWHLYRYVLFPAGLPALASSLRQGFSFAWRSLMGAELVLMASNHGLGFLLYSGENNSDISQVVAVMIVMVAIGMLADRLAFGPLEHRVHARFGLATA
jgi:NitT/TauT family transport system permease protein